MTTKKKPQPEAKRKKKAAAGKAAARAPAKAAARAPAKAAAKASAKPAARKATKAAKSARKAPEKDALDALATRLGLTRAQAEQRAIEALSSRGAAPKETLKGKGLGPLPQRLYLLLDGRGLDGRGMGVEVIDMPTIVGSDKHCSVWVNSPQIETRHLQIWREGESWLLEDLGTEKGTYLNDEKIKRRLVQHGDEYRLAGYLRLRTEFR